MLEINSILDELINQDQHTGTFTTKQYSKNNDDILIIEGHGKKIGSDPGELLINFGYPDDPCPCESIFFHICKWRYRALLCSIEC